MKKLALEKKMFMNLIRECLAEIIMDESKKKAAGKNTKKIHDRNKGKK